MRDPFWRSAKILLNYKRPLAVALCGALTSAGCFGAGVGMLVFVLSLLLEKQRTVVELIESKFLTDDQPRFVQELGQWLVAHVPDDPFYAFVLVMAVVAALSVIGSVGRYVHALITITVAHRAVMVWRGRMFRRLLHAPFIELLQTGSADHITRVIYDTRLLVRSYQALLGRSVEQILRGVAAVTVAFWFDMWLTLIALITAPPVIVLLRMFGKRIRRASRRAMRQRGYMVAALKAALGGVAVVKANNAEGYERRRFSRINRKLFGEEMKIRSARALASPAIDTLGLFGVIAVATLAAYYIFNAAIDVSDTMTVLVSLALAAGSLKPLANLNNQINEGRAAAGRLFELMALSGESTVRGDLRDLPVLPRHRRSVIFDDVTFGYPGQANPAIDHLSLEVEHGQTVAIVGGNGSGKTTLLSLLPRLLVPQSGRILIDTVDIANVRLRGLREQIAVVTQQTILFEGTIAENIAYGRQFESHDKIVAAAQAAFADEFIRTLPDGYDTTLGEDGVGLSGGQRQRIAIARAILRNPAIFILDEATSQIDADSESKINRAMSEFRRNRTVLVVAHRLSTVVDADRIVVLDAGRIVDQGRHEQLLQRCALYQTLTHRQLLQRTPGQ